LGDAKRLAFSELAALAVWPVVVDVVVVAGVVGALLLVVAVSELVSVVAAVVWPPLVPVMLLLSLFLIPLALFCADMLGRIMLWLTTDAPWSSWAAVSWIRAAFATAVCWFEGITLGAVAVGVVEGRTMVALAGAVPVCLPALTDAVFGVLEEEVFVAVVRAGWELAGGADVCGCLSGAPRGVLV